MSVIMVQFYCCCFLSTVSLLSYWLLNVDAHTQVSPPQTLPLSNKAKLEWIGLGHTHNSMYVLLGIPSTVSLSMVCHYHMIIKA